MQKTCFALCSALFLISFSAWGENSEELPAPHPQPAPVIQQALPATEVAPMVNSIPYIEVAPSEEQLAYRFLEQLPPLPNQTVTWAPNTACFVYTVKEKKSDQLVAQVRASNKHQNIDHWQAHRDYLRQLRSVDKICEAPGYIRYLHFYLESSSFILRAESTINLVRCGKLVTMRPAKVDAPVPSTEYRLTH